MKAVKHESRESRALSLIAAFRTECKGKRQTFGKAIVENCSILFENRRTIEVKAREEMFNFKHM